jgi:hypothetical protein
MNIVAVMAGLVPAIHVSDLTENKTWMPGTRPGMTINANLACFSKHQGNARQKNA